MQAAPVATAEEQLERLNRVLGAVSPRLLGWAYRQARALPFVRARLERGYDEVLASAEAGLRPYRGRAVSYARLPATGTPGAAVLAEMQKLAELERERWQQGYVSGAVYHGDPEHIELLSSAYALHSQSNPLHADVWPSATKYESEIVSMTAGLLGAGEVGAPISGTVTSGGTESILLAMKAYR
ncbi:MAG TPA: hypothetical protein VNN80_06505, partial [Polyangiaceae bacterium]|nr:hypothetical protein [Polyangiaceae bacterium]